MTMRILKSGMLTTVQDAGRFGTAHLGISPGGAADALALRVANLLVGNDENAPALEMTMVGASVEFDAETTIAITGADIHPSAGALTWRALDVPAGFVLNCGPLANGVRSYLAVHGGIRVTPVMNSAATFLPGDFGGCEGRALHAGDVLHEGTAFRGRDRKLRPQMFAQFRGSGPLRVTRGVQWDWFDAGTTERFFSTTYTVSAQSNRNGLRLQGSAIAPRDNTQLLTEGIALGAVQVPPDGQPIILFVDQQTTGGYPKIANVIAADMHRVGQLRPGDEIRFELVTIEQAVTLLRKQENLLSEAFYE